MLSVRAFVQAWPRKCLRATRLIRYLSSAYYVSDAILGARDSAMNKRGIKKREREKHRSVSRGDNILVGETDNIKIKK